MRDLMTIDGDLRTKLFERRLAEERIKADEKVIKDAADRISADEALISGTRDMVDALLAERERST